MSRDTRLVRMQSSVARAGRRLRYRVALGRRATWLPLPPGAAAVGLAALKVLGLGPKAQSAVLWGVGASARAAGGAVLHGLWKRPPRWAGSLALDEYHRLDDRLTSALELLETPASERS